MKVVQDGQYNIGHICTRWQCDNGRADKIALRLLRADGSLRVQWSFADLDRRSNQFANVLRELGFRPGDVLFTFLPRCEEQFVVFLGALKAQVVIGTLFANFGEEALLDRLGDARARGLVTRSSLYRKIRRIRGSLPDLSSVMLIDGPIPPDSGLLDYHALLAEMSADFAVPPTPPDMPSVLHYTSGSTGKPKGVQHVHRSVLHQSETMHEVFNLLEDDRYWCTAEQGWVTGTSYGIIGPWSLGVTQVQYEGGYEPRRWFDILAGERVNVWYTSPTALRMLMQEDPELFRRVELSALRHIFSVGEPLNPEVVAWGRRVLDRDVHDTYFQTETGGIMVANRPQLPIRPGSMGMPVASVEAAVIDDAGEVIDDPQRVGNLCVRQGWTSMFVAYLNREDEYRRRFRNTWYYTGDQVYRDADGYFWFVGRADDVINTAGHLISPFEIESALLEIAEIAEAAAVAIPDSILFEKVAAFVKVRPGICASAELELKIRLHVSNRVSTIATPQVLRFVDSIPKNKSGKIMRRVLRATLTGEDPGDLSTKEDTP